MKSLRDHLLDQHQQVEPQLDALRTSVLASLPPRPRRHVLATGLAALWRELFAPYRMAWSALATIWVLLLALNSTLHPPAPGPRLSPAEMAATVSGLKDKELLLAELTSPAGSFRSDWPKPLEN